MYYCIRVYNRKFVKEFRREKKRDNITLILALNVLLIVLPFSKRTAIRCKDNATIYAMVLKIFIYI